MTLRSLFVTWMGAATLGAMTTAALADPPGRVGRVSYVEGEVSLQPPQSQDWTDAFVNYPVTTSEAFWTGDHGRLELQMGPVHARLDNDTAMDISSLRYGSTLMALSQGSLNVQIPVMPRGGVGVMTPAGEVHLDRVGIYRIDVSAPTEDGSYPATEVTVFEGVAHTPGADGVAELDTGQAGVLYAGFDPEIQAAEDSPIDQWSRERAAVERWQPEPDFSPELTGAADMSQYGAFEPSDQYGRVWFPSTVPGDWAPYHYGHWAYVAPWGYTWIDDQPWGFTPFHYGRWVRVGGRWGWVRGQVEVEPVYAPALVAFVGGGGWSIGASFGGVAAVGWIPLGPQEVYRPPYEVSDGYLRQVNHSSVRTEVIETVIVNKTVNITINNYQNGGAATVMRADAMSHGAAVRTAAIPVSAEVLAKAPAAKISVVAPPAREAQAGGVRAGGQTPRAAAPPPAKLAAVRAAVAAAPEGSAKPPAIAGAKIMPPKPHTPGASIRTPAAVAQGRAAPAPAATHTPVPPTTRAPAKPAQTPAAAPKAETPMTRTPKAETPKPAEPTTESKPTTAAPRAEAPRPARPPATETAPAKPATAHPTPPKPGVTAPKEKTKPEKAPASQTPTP